MMNVNVIKEAGLKSGKKILLALILLFLGLVLFSGAADNTCPTPSQHNCYTILVGKKASADGSVMVAHNEDDYGDIIVNVRKIAPQNYGPSVKINLGHGAVYETDGHINGFLWIEATGQEFADSFINDYGVVITSDACSSKENKDDLTDGGISYMLRRIVAEKAKSAREAVKLVGELVEKFGYRSSGRTYSIADKKEAWMVAVIKGRHWFAQRVPDDEVAVIPNYYTIRHIRLDDPDNFIGSPDIIEYAKQNGWYDETRDGPFDFKRAFSRSSTREPDLDGNSLRMWRGLTLLSGKELEINGDYPFSFKPARKVTSEMLMALLRDHYEGTKYDATDGYKNGSPNRTRFRTICTSSTINSFVACLNDKKPEPISILVWLALDKPDTTVYLPIYYGVEKLPDGLGCGPAIQDNEKFLKQHFDDSELRVLNDKLLQTRVVKFKKTVENNYGQMIEVVQKELLPVEKEHLEGYELFEIKFLSLYSRDKKAAQECLNDYVASAFKRISVVYDKLLEKFKTS
jgi:dipeptidase